MKPPIPIHDKRFVYTNASHTDLRARFRSLGFKPPSEHRAPVLPMVRKKT